MCTSCEEKRRRLREEALKKREEYMKTIEERKSWNIIIPESKIGLWRRDICKNCWQYNFYCICKKLWVK